MRKASILFFLLLLEWSGVLQQGGWVSFDDGKLHRRQGDGHALVWDLGEPCASP